MHETTILENARLKNEKQRTAQFCFNCTGCSTIVKRAVNLLTRAWDAYEQSNTIKFV